MKLSLYNDILDNQKTDNLSNKSNKDNNEDLYADDDEQKENYLSQIRDEFTPNPSFYSCNIPENFLQLYSVFESKVKKEIEHDFNVAFDQNNMTDLINTMQKLVKSLLELGFYQLEEHFKQVINNLKNIFTERCIIFPAMLSTFLQTLERECEKIKKQEVDNLKLFKKDKKTLVSSQKIPKYDNKTSIEELKTCSSNSITKTLKTNNRLTTEEIKEKLKKLNPTQLISSSNPLKDYSSNKTYSPSRYSPDIKDASHCAFVEKEIFSKVKPVAFNGLFKNVYANSEDISNELNKFIKQEKEEVKEKNSKYFKKGKPNPDSAIFESYPFKQQKYSCNIY